MGVLVKVGHRLNVNLRAWASFLLGIFVFHHPGLAYAKPNIFDAKLIAVDDAKQTKSGTEVTLKPSQQTDNIEGDRATGNQNFMTLADIHFTPFVNCQSSMPCPLILKLKNAPVSQWTAIFKADKEAFAQYHQDTNYPLLESAMASTSRTAKEKHIQFVIVLGDTLAHDYRELYKVYSGDRSFAGYQSFVHKTYQYINAQLATAFPRTSVYMVVGNNDSYHGDYATQVGGAYFQDQGSLWSTLIQHPTASRMMRQRFSKAGYYSVELSAKDKLKLIVINTNLFSSKARGKNVEQAATEQLRWLHEQLSAARANQQTVFIASHIPEGIDVFATLRIRGVALIEFWRTEYIKQYQAEMNEFAPEVAAIFAGHLHADWMQILRFKKMNEIPVTGTPSISPVFGNNPGYKIYTYSPTAKKLIDFETYYLPLNGKQLWSMEYQFNHVYQYNCHNCAITAGIDLIHKDTPLATLYRTYYTVSTENRAVVASWNPYYMCAIWNVNPHAYKECLG